MLCCFKRVSISYLEQFTVWEISCCKFCRANFCLKEQTGKKLKLKWPYFWTIYLRLMWNQEWAMEWVQKEKRSLRAWLHHFLPVCLAKKDLWFSYPSTSILWPVTQQEECNSLHNILKKWRNIEKIYTVFNLDTGSNAKVCKTIEVKRHLFPRKGSIKDTELFWFWTLS